LAKCGICKKQKMQGHTKLIMINGLEPNCYKTMLPTFMICVADFRDLRRTLSPTFSVHCNRLNSIRATKTDLSQICHDLCRTHFDMSRLFLSATFMIYVLDFHRNFIICHRLRSRLSWFVSTTFPAGFRRRGAKRRNLENSSRRDLEKSSRSKSRNFFRSRNFRYLSNEVYSATRGAL